MEMEELQNRLNQIQIQLANKEKDFKENEFIKDQQTMKKLDRQVLKLQNEIAEINKPEQIEELYRQRDTLIEQVEGFHEQAAKAGFGSEMEKLQNRLNQIQIQLANKEKEFFATQRVKIFVESVPEHSMVRILNIDQGFRQGMELEPGKYHVEVSSEGYEPKDKWIEVGPGEEKVINFELEKIIPKIARLHVEPIPEDASVRILNVIPKFIQGMELKPGSYHVEVAAVGYEPQRHWIELAAGHEEPFRFELVKISTKIGWLYIDTVPKDAKIRILNINQRFQQGMELEPGKYHVQISSEGYEPQRRGIELDPGKEKRITFKLIKKQNVTITGPSDLKIVN